MKNLFGSVLLLVCSVPGCQSIPKNINAPESKAFVDTDSTWWGKYFSNEIESQPGKSGFYPLQAGTDALVARLESIRRAERSLDIQYYIWNDDAVGNLVWSELLKAADRGVRVRLLLDDLNIGTQQDFLLALNLHKNIEIRMFNPFINRKWRIFELFRFSKINRRMHNKALIADNRTAIVGGRNIGNEYFTASLDSNFGDYDVWCFGPVVPEASQAFDLFWKDNLSVPITYLNDKKMAVGLLDEVREVLFSTEDEMVKTVYGDELQKSDLSNQLRSGRIKAFWGHAKVFSDSPSKIRDMETGSRPPMLNKMTALPIQSSQEIFIISPYFIPGKVGVAYFRKKVRSGVHVEVLTNSLASNDVGLAFAGYKRYRKDLLKAGVEIREMKSQVKSKVKKSSMVGTSGARLGLHGKVYIFDRRVMFVGSMNLDPRSVVLNTEMGILLDSAELAEGLIKDLQQDLRETSYSLKLGQSGALEWHSLENNKEIIFYSEPEASVWKNFKSSFLSLFVPESLL